jgi:hypothetical protein
MNTKRRPLKKDGRILAVVRPEDPKAAVAEARRIMEEEAAGKLTHEQAHAQFEAVLGLQPYRFVGLACADLPKRNEMPLLLHPSRLTVIEGDSVRPGDSFVSFDPSVHVLGGPSGRASLSTWPHRVDVPEA